MCDFNVGILTLSVMLGIKLQDRVKNVEIRRPTKVRDIGEIMTCCRVGDVARQSDGRWTSALKDWWPRMGKRAVG